MTEFDPNMNNQFNQTNPVPPVNEAAPFNPQAEAMPFDPQQAQFNAAPQAPVDPAPQPSYNQPFTSPVNPLPTPDQVQSASQGQYRSTNGNVNPYSSTKYPNSNYQQPQGGYTSNQPYSAPQQPVYGEDPTKNISIWAMVLGIASAALAFTGYFALLGLGSGVAAIILAVKAGKESPYGKRNGMATAGLICGIIGVALCVIGFACAACVGAAACAGLSSYGY